MPLLLNLCLDPPPAVVPSDENGNTGLTKTKQVQAYYTRLLRRGKRGECFVVNYSLVRVLKGPASC